MTLKGICRWWYEDESLWWIIIISIKGVVELENVGVDSLGEIAFYGLPGQNRRNIDREPASKHGTFSFFEKTISWRIVSTRLLSKLRCEKDSQNFKGSENISNLVVKGDLRNIIVI